MAKGNIASPAQRLGGYFIDGIIWTVVLFVVLGFADTGSIFASLITLAGLGLLLFFWSKSTSPGKKVLGLTVRDANTGKPLGLGLMIIRETVGKAISGLVFSLGYLWLLWDKNNQCWHDKLVNSIVTAGGEFVETDTQDANTLLRG